MKRFIIGMLKFLIFCCFLLSLAGFSGIATTRYIFETSQVEIPDLTGKHIEYATDFLAEQHLRLRLVDRQLDERIPADHILAQEPAAGTFVKKKQTVRVVLSQGAEESIVPDLRGKSLKQARKLLSQAALRSGMVSFAHSPTIPVDAIIAQTPFAQALASVRDSVALLVSRGPYPKVMVMPDFVEQPLASARERLEQLGLVLSKVEHEKYPQVPVNTVLSQVPKPGALIQEYNMVTLVVSTGGSGRPARGSSGRALPTQYQNLHYMVPLGPLERDVSVLVKNSEGIAEVFHQVVSPGRNLTIRIPVIGNSVIEVYLDGTLDAIQRMNLQ